MNTATLPELFPVLTLTVLTFIHNAFHRSDEEGGGVVVVSIAVTFSCFHFCISHRRKNMSNITTLHNATELETRNKAYALVFGSVIVLGLPLNAVSLWILLRRHSLKSPSAVFMVNLAISDLLLVISLPMRVYFYATGTWPLNKMACLWITMLFRNNIRSSSIFITFISVDRLLAVVYPLRSRHLRNASNAWKSVAFIWLAVIVVNIPESFHFFRNSANESTCFELNPKKFARSPLVAFLSVIMITLLAINIVCTVLVSCTLHRRPSDSTTVSNTVNIMLIFVMNLVMFTIFFMPLSVGLLIETPAIMPLICLATVNCCLDPLLYYFSFDGFWKGKEDVDHSQGQVPLNSI